MQTSLIRQRHQTVARLLALGESTASVVQATGYSAAHIRSLQKDDSFQELLKSWQTQLHMKFDAGAIKIRDAAFGAIDEINRRLEACPEELTTKDLVQAAGTFLDRAGYGAKTTLEVKATAHVVEGYAQPDPNVFIQPEHEVAILDEPTSQADAEGEDLRGEGSEVAQERDCPATAPVASSSNLAQSQRADLPTRCDGGELRLGLGS